MAIDKELIGNAIKNIINEHNKDIKEFKKKKKKKIDKRQLEIALTVLLVDLASCDQNFEADEYHIIGKGLMRIFGTKKTDLSTLINQAQVLLKNMRGVSSFAKLLKENLEEEEKQIVLEIIEEVIRADGKEDGFETYLRERYKDLLGAE